MSSLDAILPRSETARARSMLSRIFDALLAASSLLFEATSDQPGHYP